MAVLTVRNLPDEVHRALRLRAAQHGRSMEAEVRSILEDIIRPPERLMLGSMLQELSRRVGLTNADVAAMEAAMDVARDRAPHEPMRFD
jgi:plasmid stability protein